MNSASSVFLLFLGALGSLICGLVLLRTGHLRKRQLGLPSGKVFYQDLGGQSVPVKL